MKFMSAAILAVCLASETLAEAVAWNDNSPRSIGDRTLDKRTTVSTLPLENPLCNGYSVSVANISSAVQQGVSLNNNNQQIGKNNYPHVFKNYENFTWKNCPSADQEPFYEFPVLRNSQNPWQPSDRQARLPNEPDRAIFQINSDTTATYCGMITHSGAFSNGGFVQCTGAGS